MRSQLTTTLCDYTADNLMAIENTDSSDSRRDPEDSEQHYYYSYILNWDKILQVQILVKFPSLAVNNKFNTRYNLWY